VIINVIITGGKTKDGKQRNGISKGMTPKKIIIRTIFLPLPCDGRKRGEGDRW
jgi:hypothetical protein